MLDGVTSPRKHVETRETVVIRFAGDSGDGMQVTGMQFTTESALAGNDLATLPDFPAEIRAPAESWSKDRFRKTPELVEANVRALRAGHNFAENAELFAVSYEIRPAKIAPGKYRNITGNTATALGFVCAAQKAGRPLFLGSYPSTPASDVLHELSGWKQYGVYTLQPADEIAGVGAALGAAFGGAIAITTTSGPGMNLKADTVGLALAVALPIAVTALQRPRPSTGMPTKTEQADLLMAMYGRHGESPVPVLAAATPADCFRMAFEAVRIAVKYMTPVVLL